MIEIPDDNPWADHLDRLLEELRHHERAADQVRNQYVRDRERAELWELEEPPQGE